MVERGKVRRMKIGDKAKVVDKESLLYNKTVELIEVSDEAYIFNSETPKLKLVVHESAMQRTIEWESSPDRGENNFDKLLGQNGELVEERKKQVLAGAFGIARQHYKDKPNKMEMVAKLFGKNLGERFTVERHGEKFDCAITRYGIDCFFVYENPYMEFIVNALVLYDLLTGEAVIVDG
jgi:hypothetical protein